MTDTKNEATNKEAKGKTEDKKSLFPVRIETTDAAKDPLRLIIEILKDDKISDEDKTQLIVYSQERFKNRRKMAYASLYAIIGSLIFMLIAAIVDGFTDSTILAAIHQNSTMIGWIEGFLTAIVAAYYGVSAWRPAS
ncbi:hypothetical protein L2750_12910 [Shewanella submarina]|uniref:Uncharacterized protein n=1 Tax=Shewanella submarina TaxID=2016376 RepID=A0ABV7GE60_9GAMM|nr:hypothetical protein [Shewanella submarina]MCL1038050.1 hypothetical protein [Shewanella submarina]